MSWKTPYNKDQNFFKVWSSKMAYVFGMIISDGCINDYHVIRIVNNDKLLLEKIKEFMNIDNPIYARCYRSKNRVESHGYVLQIGSKQMCEDLINLGITCRKSKTIKFPEIPKKYLSYFLQGLIDGDGSVYTENHKVVSPINRIPPLKYKEYNYIRLVLSIVSGSKEFLNGLKKLIPEFHGNGFYVSANTNKALKLCKFIYNEPLVKSRKFNNYLAFIS